MTQVIKNSEGKPLNLELLMKEAKLTKKASERSVRKLSDSSNVQELVDTLADCAQVLFIIVKALEDGFQLSDLFQFLPQEAIIREIIDDYPQAVEAFTSLKPIDAQNTVIRLKLELISRGVLIEGVLNKVLNGMYAGANTYDLIMSILIQGQRQLNEYRTILSDGSIVPDKELQLIA